MIEVEERQTAEFLKSKIMEVVKSYGVSITQIFSVTCDNGSNMIAAVKLLKKEITTQSAKVSQDDYDEDDDTQPETEEEFLELLSHELKENLSLIRCAVHTLQLAILEIVNKSNESVKAVTAIAKKYRNIKYKANFKFRGASFPPIWGQTRWGGIYVMMESFIRQQKFFDELADQFPELGKYLSVHLPVSTFKSSIFYKPLDPRLHSYEILIFALPIFTPSAFSMMIF